MKKPETATVAKITRPDYSSIIMRKRLFRLLDRGRKASILWISGPPGAGKTILASSYVESRRLQCLWYQLDSGDRDLATFFYYMGLALRSLSPRRKNNLPLLTPEYLPNIVVFSRRFFEGISASLKAPTCVVLDNYHEVENPVFDEALREGLEAVSKGISVIILSRTEPPPSFARLRANNSLEVLGWSDLRLTMEESQGIIRIRGGRGGIGGDKAGEIHRITDGWAAGLVLALEKSKQGGRTSGGTGIGIDTIFDYFSSEIIDKLDPETSDFLMKTAVFPHMDARMAEALTGVHQAGRILMNLSQKNCFTEKRTDKSVVFQYHPLFHEFLSSRLKESLSAAEYSGLLTKAGTILEEAGLLEDAFALMREAEDRDAVMRLIMKHAQALLLQGRLMVLEEWIASIPAGMVDISPWLLYWLGLSRTPSDLQRACGHMESAFALFKRNKDKIGVFLAWAGYVYAKLHSMRGLEDIDRWIDMLEELMDEFGGFPSEDVEASVTSTLTAALCYRGRKHTGFDYWAGRAVKSSQDCGNTATEVLALIHLGMNKITMGDVEGERVASDSLRRIIDSGKATPLVRLTYFWYRLVIDSLTGKYEESLKTMDEGLRLGESSGVHVMDMMILGHGALISMNGGDYKTADRLLKNMEPYLASSRQFDRSFYDSLMVHRAILSGDLKDAMAYLEMSLREMQNVGYPLIEALNHIPRALVHERLNEPDRAAHHLKEALRLAREWRYRPAEFMCLLLDSYFAFEAGEEARGLDRLREAMALGSATGLYTTYLWYPDIMERLCLKALDSGIETLYVQEIIKRRKIIPKSQPLQIENWPWPVRIYTMGRFGFLKYGKPVEFSRKTQQKPLDLLKALISLGGRDVPEQSLTDALWPDADGDAAHSAFTSTLHRLRQLAEADNFIYVNEGRLTLDARYCWVDAWALERLLGAADSAVKSGYGENTIRTVENAISMYHGHFLAADADKAWTMSVRERLRRKVIHHIGDIGRHYETTGQYKLAIRCYEKGVEVDDLLEAFYYRLMVCYQKLGRRAEAITIYKRLESILSSVLGVGPSEKMVAVYKELVSK